MRVLLYDISHAFWAGWFATKDQPVSAGYDNTVGSVRAMADKYDRVAICCDSPGKGLRHDIDPEYKANREKRDPQAFEQLRRAIATLVADGHIALQRAGYEADDIIASAMSHLVVDGHEVDIATADKDLMALCQNATIVSTRTGDRFGEAEVMAKFGVPPCDIPALLALAGDTSDNIKGVKRCGFKTAAKLLSEYGSLPAIVSAAMAGKLTPALGNAVVEADASGDLEIAQKLVALQYDALTAKQAAEILKEREPQCETASEFTDGGKWDDEGGTGDMGDTTTETASETTTETHDEPQADGTVLQTQTEVVVDKRRHKAGPTVPATAPPPAAPSEPELSPQLEAVAEETAKRPEFTRSLEPQTMAEAKKLSQIVYDSRLFSAYGTVQAVLLVLMAGREFGWGAMTALRNFDIVEGRPVLKSQSMMALCLIRKDVCKVFRVLHSKCDAKSATVLVQRTDWDEPQEIPWTIEDAKAAGLLHKKNWEHYPGLMLINRCIAIASRFNFADIVGNIHSADELGAETVG